MQVEQLMVVYLYPLGKYQTRLTILAIRSNWEPTVSAQASIDALSSKTYTVLPELNKLAHFIMNKNLN
jgi:hypothetical protein